MLLSVELCSLTLQREDLSIPNLIASGLFGDGAAAAVVVGAERAGGPASAGAARSSPRARSSTPTPSASWAGTSPSAASRSCSRPTCRRWSTSTCARDVDAFLAEHGLDARATSPPGSATPAGPKVLEAMEEALELPRRGARAHLAEPARGRQPLLDLGAAGARATRSRSRRPPAGSLGMLLAMGPGFCSELVLLRVVGSRLVTLASPDALLLLLVGAVAPRARARAGALGAQRRGAPSPAAASRPNRAASTRSMVVAPRRLPRRCAARGAAPRPAVRSCRSPSSPRWLVVARAWPCATGRSRPSASAGTRGSSWFPASRRSPSGPTASSAIPTTSRWWSRSSPCRSSTRAWITALVRLGSPTPSLLAARIRAEEARSPHAGTTRRASPGGRASCRVTVTDAEILAGIAAVAREHLGFAGELAPDLRLVEDLRLDSIKLLTLAVEVENRFRVRLDPRTRPGSRRSATWSRPRAELAGLIRAEGPAVSCRRPLRSQLDTAGLLGAQRLRAPGSASSTAPSARRGARLGDDPERGARRRRRPAGARRRAGRARGARLPTGGRVLRRVLRRRCSPAPCRCRSTRRCASAASPSTTPAPRRCSRAAGARACCSPTGASAARSARRSPGAARGSAACTLDDLPAAPPRLCATALRATSPWCSSPRAPRSTRSRWRSRTARWSRRRGRSTRSGPTARDGCRHSRRVVLAAALPRHGADRLRPPGARAARSLTLMPPEALHRPAGALAARDLALPRHDLAGAELRLRPVRRAHPRRGDGRASTSRAGRWRSTAPRPSSPEVLRALRRRASPVGLPRRGADAGLRPLRGGAGGDLRRPERPFVSARFDRVALAGAARPFWRPRHPRHPRQRRAPPRPPGDPRSRSSRSAGRSPASVSSCAARGGEARRAGASAGSSSPGRR